MVATSVIFGARAPRATWFQTDGGAVRREGAGVPGRGCAAARRTGTLWGVSVKSQAGAAPRIQATFAFVDLAGFTALTEAQGDEDAADVAVRFATLARAALAPGDRLIKTIGDAVLVTSP